MHQCLKNARIFCQSVAHTQPSVLCAASLYTGPCRMTHVVEHFTPQKLQSHKMEPAPNSSKRHFLCDPDHIYKHVRHEASMKMPPLEVILLTTVEGVGTQGEVIKMSAGRARKRLLLPKLGVYASPENLKTYAYLKNEDNSNQPSSMYSPKTVAILGGLLLTVQMNMHEPWVLAPWHVKMALRKAGIKATDDAIAVPERPIRGPNMDYENKMFYVTMTINKREKVRVRCVLTHVSRESRYLQTSAPSEEQEGPLEALFAEDAPYLNALHQQRAPTARYMEPQLQPETVAAALAATNADTTGESNKTN